MRRAFERAWGVAALLTIIVGGLAECSAHAMDVDVRGADLVPVLRAMAEVTGENVVFSEAVKGRVDVRLQGVDAHHAFEALLRSRGLTMRRSGDILWIAPHEEVAASERVALDAEAKRSALGALQTRGFQLNYQKADTVRRMLMGENGRRILSERGSAAADTRTNQLFVADVPARLDEAEALLRRIDIPVRQVLIEARIVEADDKFSRNLGVKLGFTRAGGGTSLGADDGAPGGPAARGHLPDQQILNLPAVGINGFAAPAFAINLFGSAAGRFLELELSALEADGRGKVISSPRVVTADKVQALIEQGTELPYQVSAGGNGATSVQFRRASLRLEVTPQITPDGQVILDVDVHKDSVGQQTANGYAVDTKHVRTQVLVENGGTVAIGGIYQIEARDADAKVPVLGDIPVLGHLFKHQAKTRNRTELLVFLTPRVIDSRPSGTPLTPSPAPRMTPQRAPQAGHNPV